MGYRLSWVAGVVGIGFALLRAGRLLRPSIDGLPWQAVMIAAAVLGIAITWTAVAYRLRARWVAAANLLAAALALVRIAVPDTTWFVFPTAASLQALSAELALARDVIRSGVAPVIPLAGIVAILAVVFWSLGALLAWGLLANRPYVAVIAPLVVYLEFAVMDKRPSTTWAVAFMLAIGFALLAVALDQRRADTGLLTSAVGRRPLARSLPALGVSSIAIALLVAFTSSRALADLVPRTGYVDWRASSGLSGQYFGSVSYNPFVGIRQSLISSSNVPVFAAEVGGELDGRSVYWRLVTLDSFDGAQWHVGAGASIVDLHPDQPLEASSTAFAGPTARISSTVTIAALQMDWLPAAYSPVRVTSPVPAVERGLRVKADDASLRFDALTYRGMTYTVISDVPMPRLDVLALGDDGRPSPVFSGAIDANEFHEPQPDAGMRPRDLPDRDRYLALPTGMDAGIGALARSQVAGLQTDFERGMALESFFRSAAFRYSTQIAPGHGARDLADWLLVPDSPNYRVGYCEQFATAMAVMARTIGIPSRVVLGFTPGTLADDGRIVVRDRNAHAWVELWMPSQGWVRFDPTPRGDGANPPTISALGFDVARYLEVPRGALAAPGPPPGGLQLFIDDDETVVAPPTGSGQGDTGERSPGISLPIPGRSVVGSLLVVLLAGALPIVKWERRRRRLRRLDDGDVAAAWQEIVDRLSDLGDAPRRSATPAEIAGGTTPSLLPLADVYAEATYGPPTRLSPEAVALARRSLANTEHQLIGRYSLGRRIVSRYRLASVLPPRWRRPRASRASYLARH
jgi:transglutaminase-like putative cysteine protease